MKYNIWIILLIAFLFACHDSYDAERVAEGFCECMKDNDAARAYTQAADVCYNKLIAENRYFKLWSVDMSDHELDKNVSNETRDSVKLFFHRFTDYVNTHCCEEVLACRDSTELK